MSEMVRAKDIIALIPEVKPRLAMAALRDAVSTGKIGNTVLSDEDRKLAIAEGWGMRISPIGGRILKQLFEAGMIPQKRAGSPKDLSELVEYVETEADFRAKVEVRIAAKEAYEYRIAEIAENPDCARADELSSDLIDKVFLKRLGYRKFGTLHIAGLECHKDMTAGSLSNSGKTRYSGQVYCYWLDAEGNRQGDAVPETVRNRRNDPDRNWGLGRE
ncbi:hypothetical protein SAMN05444273_109114 [Litoreibacter ascidiaceicola]|uniref:Uncharacterized protein n=1 Tax=Litoreibacter ascidiaceicola TaxID=1486859 RepID=A0A1M5DMM8_9RHOB|nr:hypothetical protein [Litoreibacter ascidiaceicola]SHF68210.1 hypothetical protein SAMN05444273_109114 [Litoreibacter ascidiaceicola]